MKILFVNRMMGVSWGGGENYDFNLANELKKRGHEVLFLTGGRNPEHGPEQRGIESVPVDCPYLRGYMYSLAGKVPFIPGVFAELDLALFRRAARDSIERLVEERDIDVVQVLAIPAFAAWISKSVPTVMRFPGPPAWFQSGTLSRLSSVPRSKMFTHGDAVHYFQDRLSLSVDNIPPGIDHATFRRPSRAERNEARTSLNLKDGDFALITVGRLIDGKGHEFLLNALAAHRPGNLRLLIVGDGPLRGRFEQQVRSAGIENQVMFLGQANTRQVATYLRAADAFCLLSSYENYSNATLEAMAAGLPVLATRVGGFPKQVTDGENGYLIAHGNIGEFGDRLSQVMSNPQQREQLSANAEAFARNFSWAAAAEKVERLYGQIV